ncbi:MAG: hypothetical protein M3063_05665 [Actinomycetota bacterium]|nr:hypothetical protein [Actinomycetota bacterium]
MALSIKDPQTDLLARGGRGVGSPDPEAAAVVCRLASLRTDPPTLNALLSDPSKLDAALSDLTGALR